MDHNFSWIVFLKLRQIMETEAGGVGKKETETERGRKRQEYEGQKGEVGSWIE